MTSSPALPDALSAEPYPNAPPGVVVRWVLALRQKLIAFANALLPPEVVVLELSTGIASTAAIAVVARLGIVDLLLEGPRTADELAAITGCDADALHRLMRTMAKSGMFSISEDSRFANNKLSLALRSGTLSRTKEWALYFGSRSNCEAWLDLEQTLKTGKNAFDRVHGMSVWDWFDQHPDERETFAQAMMGLTVRDAPAVAALYPFAEVKRLCDVGGGRGTLLSELLIRHPHLHGVLCDGPGVIDSARTLLDRRGVLGRVELVAGSFFDRVPPGSDAYLLKNVLHDWDDARCLKILGTCRAAMQPGQRVLVVETLVERNSVEGMGPLSDVQMMMVSGEGRERSEGEVRTLLRASGFKASRIFEGPTVSVIEGLAQ